MSQFFRDGGFGMFPVLLFGFFAVASGVLFVLRPERRFVGLMVSLAVTTLAASLLAFSVGMIGVFRYVQAVPAGQQLQMISSGASDSLHGVALALVLLMVTGLVASVGALRSARIGPSTPADA